MAPRLTGPPHRARVPGALPLQPGTHHSGHGEGRKMEQSAWEPSAGEGRPCCKTILFVGEKYDGCLIPSWRGDC